MLVLGLCLLAMGPACLQPSNCLHEGHLSEIFGLRLGLGLASIYLQWAQGNVGHTASTNGCTADHDQLSWFRPFPTMWMCPHVAKILTRTANERIVTACASTYSHTLLQRCVSQDLQTHCSTISSDHSAMLLPHQFMLEDEPRILLLLSYTVNY